MEKYDHKVEERKRYLKYFRVWMILAAIAVVVYGAMKLLHGGGDTAATVRNNDQAPTQRVYDFAEKLTDEEEKWLEEKIAKYEEKCHSDLILVTIDKEVGQSDSEWTRGMVNLADDFYDQNAFGYDMPHGDGALLLDNWYHVGQSDSQAGAWLSTSGKLEYAIGKSEENAVWRAMDNGFEDGTKWAYANALEKVAYYGMKEETAGSMHLPWIPLLIIPVIVAFIYAFVNMKQAPGKDTTTPMTYVPSGKPVLKAKRDDFIRKNVSKVKIETSSGGSRGGHGGGSYGHHVSSGGFSHGGGGHRR